MQISPSLVAHRESSEAIEPGQRPLDDPPVPSEAFARVDAATGDPREDATRTAGGTTAREVVAFVRMQLVRAMAWPTSCTARLADRRDRVQGGFQPPRVMHVGRRERHGEGDPLAVDHQMALRPRFCPFAAIRRIRPGVLAPLLAATLAESSDARDQSSLSASARRWSNSWCRRSHTPVSCQSRRRRQHVIPLPHPISCGSSFQPMPLLSTKMIPVSAARSETRGRPPLGLGASGGSSGSTTAHRSSLTSALLMPPVYHPFC
jgi:hypothetical protein